MDSLSIQYSFKEYVYDFRFKVIVMEIFLAIFLFLFRFFKYFVSILDYLYL